MTEKILLYGHGGAYNHGAEAIVKTTIHELRKRNYGGNILLSTHFRKQDEEYQMPVDQYLERDMLYTEKDKIETVKGIYDEQIYAETLKEIKKSVLGLSVGGDNYCYPGWHRWRAIHNKLKQVGAKDVLWSCSIDKDNITGEMLETLASHDLITVREGLTYSYLKEMGLSNIVRCADVAFLMEAEKTRYPDNFEVGNTIAINISPLIIRQERKKGIVLDALFEVIDFIIEHTDMMILFISHVTMQMDNDNDIVELIHQHYLGSGKDERFCFCQEGLTAGQRKYLISKCKAVIAARTHAAIAAYSSKVPVLALGYSVKAAGIADDFDMSEFIQPINMLVDKHQIVDSFVRLLAKEQEIKKQLDQKSEEIIRLAEQNFTSLKKFWD